MACLERAAGPRRDCPAELDRRRPNLAYWLVPGNSLLPEGNVAKKPQLPGFYEKRKVLFAESPSPEKLLRAGRQFMEAGRYDDALEFFQRAGAHDLARQVAAVAMQAGNTPLLMRAKKVLGEGITEQEWLQVAANAEKAGLPSCACLAYSKAGREEEAARVRGLMPGFRGAEQEPAETAVPNRPAGQQGSGKG
jgi:tetratricopeptide (TPR) repeat protein